MLEIDGINNIQNPYLNNNTKAEKIVVNHNRPIYPKNPMRGLDALSVYNAAIIVKAFPADKEPLPLIYNPKDSIDSIKGERITSSDKKLVGIKAQDDKTETYYTIENNEVKSVSVKDKATGKELKYQRQIEFDSKKSIEVVENSLSDDTVHKSTWYEDGIVKEVSVNRNLPGDKYIGVSYNPVDKNENIYFDSPNEHAYIDVNDKQQVTRIFNDIRKDGINLRKTTELYNGAVISESVEKNQTVPNMAGRELANIPELQPTKKYVVDENAKSNNGNKTYYSNGAIEKNTLPNGVTYYYNPNGDIQKIVDGNKTITMIGEGQEIKEDLGNSKTKTTTHYIDGYSVELKDNNNYKEVGYTNNTIDSYYEGTISADGNKTGTKSLYFDKNGMLESNYTF